MLNYNWNKNLNYWSINSQFNNVNSNIENIDIFGKDGNTIFYLPVKNTQDILSDNRLYPNNFWNKLFLNKDYLQNILSNEKENIDISINTDDEFINYNTTKSVALNYFNTLPTYLGNTKLINGTKILFHSLNKKTYNYYNCELLNNNILKISNYNTLDVHFEINYSIRIMDANGDIITSLIQELKAYSILGINYLEIKIKDNIQTAQYCFCPSKMSFSIDYDYYASLNGVWIISNDILTRYNTSKNIFICDDNFYGQSFSLNKKTYNTYPTILENKYYEKSDIGALKLDFSYNDTDAFDKILNPYKLLILDYKTAKGSINSEICYYNNNDNLTINTLPDSLYFDGNTMNIFINKYFSYSSIFDFVWSKINDINFTNYFYSNNTLVVSDILNMKLDLTTNILNGTFIVDEGNIISIKIFNDNNILILDGLFIAKEIDVNNILSLEGDINTEIKLDIYNNFGYCSIKNLNKYKYFYEIVDTINLLNELKLPIIADDIISVGKIDVFINTNLISPFNNNIFILPNNLINLPINTIIRFKNQNLQHTNGFYKIIVYYNAKYLVKLYSEEDLTSNPEINLNIKSKPNGYIRPDFDLKIGTNTYSFRPNNYSNYNDTYNLKNIIRQLTPTANVDFDDSYEIGSTININGIINNNLNGNRIINFNNEIILGNNFPIFPKNVFIKIDNTINEYEYFVKDVWIDNDNYQHLLIDTKNLIIGSPNLNINIFIDNTLNYVSSILNNENINQEYYANLIRTDTLLKDIISGIYYKIDDKMCLEIKDILTQINDNRIKLEPTDFLELKYDGILIPKFVVDSSDWYVDSNNKLKLEQSNFGNRKIRFIDGLTYEDISSNDISNWQTKYNWILKDNVITLDAVVGLEEPGNPASKLKWYKGEWRNGTWVDGLWCSGKWIKGIWLNGVFDSIKITDLGGLNVTSNFNIRNNEFSTWITGTFISGRFKSGTWINGIFLNGNFGYLEFSPIWENGYFNNGIWENGIFYKGTFNNGNVIRGEFQTGLINNMYADAINLLIGTKSTAIDKTIINNIYCKNTTIYPGLFQNIHNNTIIWNGILNNCIWNGGTFCYGIATRVTWNDGVWLGGYKINSIENGLIKIYKNQYDSILNSINPLKYFYPYFYITAKSNYSNKNTLNNVFYNIAYYNTNYIIPQFNISAINNTSNLSIIYVTNLLDTNNDFANITYTDEPYICSVFIDGIWNNGQFLNGLFYGQFKNGYFKGLLMEGYLGF